MINTSSPLNTNTSSPLNTNTQDIKPPKLLRRQPLTIQSVIDLYEPKVLIPSFINPNPPIESIDKPKSDYEYGIIGMFIIFIFFIFYLPVLINRGGLISIAAFLISNLPLYVICLLYSLKKVLDEKQVLNLYLFKRKSLNYKDINEYSNLNLKTFLFSFLILLFVSVIVVWSFFIVYDIFIHTFNESSYDINRRFIVYIGHYIALIFVMVLVYICFLRFSKKSKKNITLVDCVANILGKDAVTRRIWIGLIFWFLQFIFLLFFNKNGIFMYFSSCLTLPFACMIYGFIENKIFGISNILGFIFILFMVKTTAIPITQILNDIFLSKKYSMFDLGLAYMFWSKNYSTFYSNLYNTPSTKCILEQKFILMQKILSGSTVANSVDNTSFVCKIKKNIFYFLNLQVSSFWKLFDPKINLNHIPKWAWYTAPTKTTWLKPNKYTILEQIFINNGIADTKNTKIRAIFWKILYESANNRKQINFSETLQNKINLNISVHFIELSSETVNLLNLCSYSVNLNAKLCSLIDRVKQPNFNGHLVREDIDMINFLGIEFRYNLNDQVILRNIQVKNPAIYEKYLKGFSIKPLKISLQDFRMLGNLFVHNMCNYDLLHYLQRDCVVRNDPNFITETSELYKLNTNIPNNINIGRVFERFNNVFLNSWDLYTYPIMRGVNISSYEYKDITGRLGISFDEEIIHTWYVNGDLRYRDSCMLRYGIENNKLYNYLKVVKGYSRILDRASFWKTTLNDNLKHVHGLNCNMTNCLNKYPIFSRSATATNILGGLDPGIVFNLEQDN